MRITHAIRRTCGRRSMNWEHQKNQPVERSQGVEDPRVLYRWVKLHVKLLPSSNYSFSLIPHRLTARILLTAASIGQWTVVGVRNYYSFIEFKSGVRIAVGMTSIRVRTRKKRNVSSAASEKGRRRENPTCSWSDTVNSCV